MMKTIFLIIFVSVSAETELNFLQANNKFTSSLYREISKTQNGNFLTSPFSAETVLALTLIGAKGPTADELKNAIHLSKDFEKIPNLEDNEYTLKAANKIYVNDNFTVKDSFAKLAPIEKINFLKNNEAATIINQWVEGQTANKIKDLINPDQITNQTRVVLVNAAYFKADWVVPFMLDLTKEMDFYVNDTNVVKVDALHNRFVQTFLYYDCQVLKAKFLELPFKGHNASMTFILPNDKNGLAKLETELDRALEPHNLTEELVVLALPKFKINTKIDLKEILQNLGVQTIFKDLEADLSGIAGEKGELVVSNIIQQAFINLNEEGVEAAAATYSMVGEPKTVFLDNPFIADHPFIFYIRVKGVIVFVGRVVNPKID